MVSTAVLEGWKAIGEALGLRANPDALRRRLRRWEEREGLPVHRVQGRVFVSALALEAWSGSVMMSQNVPPRPIK